MVAEYPKYKDPVEYNWEGTEQLRKVMIYYTEVAASKEEGIFKEHT